ncbi:MAG: hypothetical protein ACJAYG_002843 [Oceanicoccus sp.]|jgi:hypothetical protein
MSTPLTPQEVGVIGCLMEKALTEMAGRLGEEIDLAQIAVDLNPTDDAPIEEEHE